MTCNVDGCDRPEDHYATSRFPTQYVLTERSRITGELYVSEHDTHADAVAYNVGQECPNDWEIVTLRPADPMPDPAEHGDAMRREVARANANRAVIEADRALQRALTIANIARAEVQRARLHAEAVAELCERFGP